MNTINIFKEQKAIATISYLLKLSNKKCDKYWLNKVMYYIERLSLLKSGQPMFFDMLYSLKYGPIASSINDSIDSLAYPIESNWSEYFSIKSNCVSLKNEADYSLLSPFEESLIHEAYSKFKGWEFDKLYNFFHKLPENTSTSSRIPITHEDILKGEHFPPNEIQEILTEISYLNFMDEVLPSAF